MIQFATARTAPVVSLWARSLALGLAGLFVIMAVGQLFTFEETVDLVARFGFLPNHASALTLMAVLAVCEVFALPFLLRMRLSVAMRVLSMLCGWATVLLWFRIALAAVSHNLIHSNIGFFGEKLPISIGWWCVAYSLILIVVMALVTWMFWTPRALAK